MSASRMGVPTTQGAGGVSPDQIVENLLATFASPGYQPPVLPAIALELLELSRDPDVSFAKVRELLEKDSLLSARVLRVAQSPAYATAVPLRSLDVALVRLGLRTLCDIFLEVSVGARVFRAKGYAEPMAELAGHSMATAYLARLVSRHGGVGNDLAFLCGLVHDVGAAACLITLSEGGKRKADQPPFEEVAPAIGGAHAVAGERLCALWKLPEEVQDAVAHHHTPAAASQAQPLARVVCVAEWLATLNGRGARVDAPSTEVEASLKHLGVTAAAMDSLIDDARGALAKLQ